MTPSARSVFYNAAVLSGLVTEEQLREAEMAVLGEPKPGVTAPVDDLAKELVSRKLITQYQADQLKSGRNKMKLGPYLVTDWIGQGGMGQVYKAVHEVMGRETAVKVLPRDKCTPAAIENFQREIRTQAKLDHPNLVRAFDAGQDGKVHYLVTEYVPGEDLRRLVRSQGPLSMRQAANVIMQAARGLEHAHQSGLIHRDVKPGNILVTPQGDAKVSDLGLAGFIDEVDETLKSKIVGTADYLSPEQISRNVESITPVSDIYSLGCTLYYAVTGKVPYPGGTTRDKARRHLEETPWHPRRFNSEISEEFVEIIADMMEKDPRKRIQTAADVAARLEPWAGSEGSAFPTSRLGKSPWLPPPLPGGLDGEDDQDTDVGSYDELDSGRQESASQGSQWTERVLAAGQDTRVGRRYPPPPLSSDSQTQPQILSRGVSVAIALAVSIPLSMLLGAFITFLVFMALKG